MREEDGSKWLTVNRLIELLAKLPGDCRVMPNTVGNLLVQVPDGSSSLAFVDFVGEGDIDSMTD